MGGMRWAIAILIVAAVGTGCGKGSGGGNADFERQRQALVPQKPAAAPPSEEAETAPEAEVVAPERYAYDPLGKRDPFRSFVLPMQVNTAIPLQVWT